MDYVFSNDLVTYAHQQCTKMMNSLLRRRSSNQFNSTCRSALFCGSLCTAWQPRIFVLTGRSNESTCTLAANKQTLSPVYLDSKYIYIHTYTHICKCAACQLRWMHYRLILSLCRSVSKLCPKDTNHLIYIFLERNLKQSVYFLKFMAIYFNNHHMISVYSKRFIKF